MGKKKKSQDAEDAVFGIPSDDDAPVAESEPEIVNIPTPEFKAATASEDMARPESPALPAVKLQVFLKVAGSKWDQLAGFKHYATKQKLSPRTIPEWRETLQKFMSKPTS